MLLLLLIERGLVKLHCKFKCAHVCNEYQVFVSKICKAHHCFFCLCFLCIFLALEWRNCDSFVCCHTYHQFGFTETGKLFLTRHKIECNSAESCNILLKWYPSIYCPHLAWSHIITDTHRVPSAKWFSLKQRYDGAATGIQFVHIYVHTNTRRAVICPLLLSLFMSCRDDQFLTCITSNIILLLWQDAL